MEDQKKKLFLSQNQTEKTEAALKVQGRYSEMFSGLPSNGALPFYLSNGGRGYGCMGLAFGRPPEMALVGFKVAFECPHPSSHRQSDYNTFHPLCSVSLSLPREDQAFFRRRKPSGFGGSGFTSQASGVVNYKRDVGV